jgi:ketosteroid isomerase-like protein
VSTKNEALIERLYAALAARDGDAAAACYAPSATFTDPVFPDLEGGEPGAMWRMLAERSDDLQVELLEHGAEGDQGAAHWVARYTFSQTGRPILNDIESRFRFEDGLIVEQRDRFNFYEWARQALGPPGLLLGWTPIIRAAVRRRARGSLDEFMARSAQAG